MLVVTTVAGFLANRWWGFDLVANLRPQQALVLSLLAVVLITTGARLAAAVVGMGAVANLALVVPLLFGSGASDTAPGAATFEMTFLNVKIRAADPDEVIAYLQDRDDDLVILAAGTRRWVQALETADIGLHVVEGPRRGVDSELIVLSRDRDVDVTLHLPRDESRSALVEVIVDLGGEQVRVLGTHPVSPLTPARAAQRDEHFAWIAAWAQRHNEPLVVVGDLNATPWSQRLRSLLDESGLLDSQRAHGIQPSWPAGWGLFGLPLDHVLHSPALAVVNRRLGPSFGSDHRTVHAELALRATAP